jgi:hypothetical protein
MTMSVCEFVPRTYVVLYVRRGVKRKMDQER